MIDRGGSDEFDVWFPSTDGAIADEHVELARRVLERIAEMDAEARRLWAYPPDDFDYEESLADVEITGDRVRFHYGAGTCNTEWWISFDVGADGSIGPAKRA